MKRVCKQCGKEFELSEGEIRFYEKKGLELPKRCQQCRDQKAGNRPKRTVAAVVVVLLFLVSFLGKYIAPCPSGGPFVPGVCLSRWADCPFG